MFLVEKFRKTTKSPQIITDETKIDELLSRSVSSVFPSKDDLKKILLSGKRLKVYLGADATGSQLHIGHATNLILLERLRQLGHEIIILFGDFTAMIGDPTGKEAARIQLTEDQVLKNIASWEEQVAKVIDFKDKKNKPIVVKNSKWLSKLSFADVVKLASHFTVQQMIERDMFEKRLQEKKPIYLHEFFYPLMQGFDSVALDVDLEIGGNDQTFNMLAGRILQKNYNHREKFVIATTLLVDPKTNKKLMNKSDGKYIALNDSATDMFGKTMALPDSSLIQVFIDCTYVPIMEIKKIEQELISGTNPKDIKIRLAKELVTMYHSKSEADQAEINFNNTFKKGEIPQDAKSVEVEKGSALADILLHEKIVESKGELRRLIDANAVTEIETDAVISDFNFKIERNISFRIGKKRFIKINIQ